MYPLTLCLLVCLFVHFSVLNSQSLSLAFGGIFFIFSKTHKTNNWKIATDCVHMSVLEVLWLQLSDPVKLFIDYQEDTINVNTSGKSRN